MISATELADLAATAETAFVDACQIHAEAGSGTFDAVTGRYTAPADTVVYDGACLIRPVHDADSEAEFGGTAVTIGRYHVTVPRTVTGVVPDHRVLVTTSNDAALVGVTLRVVASVAGTYAPFRRLLCIRDQG